MDIQTSPLFGGTGGNEFDDYRSAPTRIVRMVSLNLRSGENMDSIQATYLLDDGRIWTGPTHGGGGGTSSQVNLSGQDLIAVLLRTGKLVDQTQFVAKAGNNTFVYGPFGGTGGGAHSIVGQIVALYGRSGDYLDAIGVYGHNLTWSQATVSKDELNAEAEALKRMHTAAAGRH